MPTIRTRKQKSPYTSISRVLLQDPRLTFEARGLASYLLSKPDDWEIDVDALIRESPAGRDAVYTIIKELCAQGYLIREKYRLRGQFQFRYTLYESRELAANHPWLDDEQPSLFDPYGKPVRQSRSGQESCVQEEADRPSTDDLESPESEPESQSQPSEEGHQTTEPVRQTSTGNQYGQPVRATSTGKPYWSCKEEQTTEQSSEQSSEQTTTTEQTKAVVVVEYAEEEILAYARGQSNIENPVGFMKSVRDGTAKDLPRILQSIGEWLHWHAPPPVFAPADQQSATLPGELVPELLESFLHQLHNGGNPDSNALYEGLLDEPEQAAQGMVNPTTFLRWFKPITAMSRGDTTVYFQVPDASFAGWITANYRDIVEEALEAIGLAGYRFEFVIRRE
jgi:hypothetical protein